MAEVLIFGDSHTAALRHGQLAIEADGQWPADLSLTVRPLGGGHLACQPFFVDRGDHAEITLPEYRRQFERLPRRDDPPNAVYGVSAPLHTVRVWRHPDWQTFAPIAARVAPDEAPTTPASSGMVRHLALDDQSHMLALVALLRRLGRRVFAIEAPYPFRHHPALQRTPAAVALRVDRLYRDAVGIELKRLGIPVVAVPEQCRDEDGFTRAEFRLDGDPHHGNGRYGAIMMGAVLAHLAAEGAPHASGADQEDVRV